MILGKDLKAYVALIPDDAVVFIDDNQNVSIERVSVSSDPFLNANLELTQGYSITKDSVIDEMFGRLKSHMEGLANG